jgi:GcrA cell cycle regulator
MSAPLANTNATRAWAAEHDAMLRACLADRATFDQAGAEINRRFGTSYTRCAVAGRAMRLGLKSRNPAMRPRGAPPSLAELARHAARRKPKPEPRSLSAAAPARPIPQFHRDNLSGLRCAEVDPLNVTLLELEEHQCRWPMTGWPAPGPTLFCGQIRCQEHESYCFAHWQLSIGAGTASERAAHRNEKVA